MTTPTSFLFFLQLASCSSEKDQSPKVTSGTLSDQPYTTDGTEGTSTDTLDTTLGPPQDTGETYNEVEGGLGAWTGEDNVAPSQLPPNSLAVEQAPLFVAFGWDDNGYSGLPEAQATGGMSWVLQMAAERNNPNETRSLFIKEFPQEFPMSLITQVPAVLPRHNRTTT